MKLTLDSDNTFATQGRILSLVRGRQEGSDNDKKNLVSLVIESEKGKSVVDLPIKTESDFEVIPYQSALIGVEVRYSKRYVEWDEGIGVEWELNLLSGALNGMN